jgi:transcriptional regulator with XRE-family HTH domain
MKNIDGRKLRDVRRIAGVSQRKLGEKLGVTKAMVSIWENGVRFVAPKHYDKLCTFLNTDISKLTKKNVTHPAAADGINYNKIKTYLNNLISIYGSQDALVEALNIPKQVFASWIKKPNQDINYTCWLKLKKLFTINKIDNYPLAINDTLLDSDELGYQQACPLSNGEPCPLSDDNYIKLIVERLLLLDASGKVKILSQVEDIISAKQLKIRK